MNAYTSTLAWAEKMRSSKTRSIAVSAKESTASTNADAKADVGTDSPETLRLFIANHQTSGRGRGDNTWSDQPGKALLSSWMLQVSRSPQPILSALVGLALFEAASKTWPDVPWALKAPNDLHVVRSTAKKMAGLLIEVVSKSPGNNSVNNDSLGAVIVVGLGMNVSDAPAGTTPYAATSLVEELKASDIELDPQDWQNFLSLWVSSLSDAMNEGLVPDLKQSTRLRLAVALARHPEYRDIKEVKADGSIVFNGGHELSWFNL